MIDWWVWLSGAVPDLEDLERFGWSEIDLRFMVGRIAEQILEAGCGIVHGGHPTYAPIIEQAARGFPDTHPRVRIVVTGYHFDAPSGEAFVQRHSYAEVELTPKQRTRDESLTAMRLRLVELCDAIVCIGGRLHTTGDRRPGLEEEIELAIRYRRPTYLLGSFGGFTQHYYQTELRADTARLRNGLDDDDNRLLAETSDPSLALKILMKGLARARAARGSGGSARDERD